MPSHKPSQAPPHDASVHEKVLYDELRKGDAFVMVDGEKILVQQSDDRYAVFADNSYPRWKRWVEGSAEFDGNGLRDVVFANALYLDAVKGDLDDHRASDLSRHQRINERLAALEAAAAQPSPFPGVSS